MWCICKVNMVDVKHKIDNRSDGFSLRLSTLFQIQNDQCQEMDQSSDKKWLKLTNHGEWATHTVRVAEYLYKLCVETSTVTVWLAALVDIFNIQLSAATNCCCARVWLLLKSIQRDGFMTGNWAVIFYCLFNEGKGYIQNTGCNRARCFKLKRRGIVPFVTSHKGLQTMESQIQK